VGFKGTPVMEVAVMKNKAGNFGIYNLTLKQSPKQLITLMAESK
jgi:hypothetical protein